MTRPLLTLLFLMFMTVGGLHAQDSDTTEVVRSYLSVGRIRWVFPKGFAYYFAVPHFTMGARVKCKGPGEECEIQVQSRDLRKTYDDRVRELTQQLQSDTPDSEEGGVRIRVLGTSERVIYATLTDSRPNQKYKLLTAGYAEKGPGLIRFYHLANEKSEVQRLLQVIENSVALDAREVWAWRLGDYKAVCEKRFPVYAQANADAFASSLFGSVDVPTALKPQFPPDSSVDEIRSQLEKSRQAFAEDFDKQGPGIAEAICRDFPKLVAEASKGLPRR